MSTLERLDGTGPKVASQDLRIRPWTNEEATLVQCTFY